MAIDRKLLVSADGKVKISADGQLADKDCCCNPCICCTNWEEFFVECQSAPGGWPDPFPTSFTIVWNGPACPAVDPEFNFPFTAMCPGETCYAGGNWNFSSYIGLRYISPWEGQCAPPSGGDPSVGNWCSANTSWLNICAPCGLGAGQDCSSVTLRYGTVDGNFGWSALIGLTFDVFGAASSTVFNAFLGYLAAAPVTVTYGSYSWTISKT